MSKEKQVALDWVEENKGLLTDVHQQIWEFAEVGLQEMKTAKLMTDILEKNGFKVEKGVAGMPSAFVATYGSGKPVIGLMGELDALPGISNKAVPYKEPLVEGGAGHGCGHNSYATTALGAAIAIKEAIDKHKLKGTLKCLGCPAEETLVGKVFMVRDGIFDGVDACLGHHPGASNTSRLSSGNAMNSVKFEFFGKASHAAGSPHQGISALDGAELMNIGVNYMREHVVQEARMHYVIEDGGHEPNVVPPYARSWYYVRAPSRDLVDDYYDRVLKMADGADLMAGTTHKVKFLTGVHNGMPNKPMAEQVVANMRNIGAPTYTDEELAWARELGKSIPKDQKRKGLARSKLPNAMELLDVDIDTNIYDPYGEEIKGGGGSSDVADVAWNVPTQQFSTAYFVVGCPGHSWQHTAIGGTSIAHKSTIFASKVMAATAIDLMTKPDLLAAVKADWAMRMEGLTYKSPLPADLKPPLDQLRPFED
ncbi:MAG TPA: amidohydrolase [Patescibacteria group bacterium]|nr:amidohydrolase [Patescibacteria group bacterium]